MFVELAASVASSPGCRACSVLVRSFSAAHGLERQRAAAAAPAGCVPTPARESAWR